MFPLMLDYKEKQKFPSCPISLPDEFVNQFAEQIEKNHAQSIQRLSERGGLHPTELCAAMYNMDLRVYFGHHPISDEQTLFAINMIIIKYTAWKTEQKKKGGD